MAWVIDEITKLRTANFLNAIFASKDEVFCSVLFETKKGTICTKKCFFLLIIYKPMRRS